MTDGDWASEQICVRCGDEYEFYAIIVRDKDIAEYARTRREWNLHQDGNDGLCKLCRMAVADYGAYLTESERAELEPKTGYPERPDAESEATASNGGGSGQRHADVSEEGER